MAVRRVKKRGKKKCARTDLAPKLLRLATDVGSAVTYKVLTPRGDYVCRLTIRPWTAVEEANPV